MAEPLKPLAEAIGVSPARERLIAAHAALKRARDSVSRTRAEQEVAAAIDGVLIEMAEAIADELSTRLDELLGFRAMIGARSNFVAGIAASKSMKLRGLIAAHEATALARPDTPQGAAALAADGCWRKFAEALASDPRAGLAL